VEVLLALGERRVSLSPVKHLFVYLHSSGIKDGFLSAKTTITVKQHLPTASGKNHLSYSTFSKWFKRMLQSVLPNEGSAFATGSTCSGSTAYKFAILKGSGRSS
jgi:hypothetical protein